MGWQWRSRAAGGPGGFERLLLRVALFLDGHGGRHPAPVGHASAYHLPGLCSVLAVVWPAPITVVSERDRNGLTRDVYCKVIGAPPNVAELLA
ncbi:MAG: hypothetical protein FWH11_13080 [Micrococcales bacterium]|nr:hypothetical protein [Micrococcales bacterium]